VTESNLTLRVSAQVPANMRGRGLGADQNDNHPDLEILRVREQVRTGIAGLPPGVRRTLREAGVNRICMLCE
jgi:hypothetical protein